MCICVLAYDTPHGKLGLQFTAHVPTFLIWTVTCHLQGSDTGQRHMDIFAMMEEVNGGVSSNGLKPVKEEEEGGGTPKGRRKEQHKISVNISVRKEDRWGARDRRKDPPPSSLEAKPRPRLKSDSTIQGGGHTTANHQSKKMTRSVQSSSEFPRPGRRSSSDSSQPSKLRQSSSYSSFKDKK